MAAIHILREAKKQRNLLDDLEGPSFQVVLHLAKLYLFGNSNNQIVRDRRHWRREVASLLFHIPKVKLRGRDYPKASLIMKAIYDSHDGSLDNVFNAVVKLEKNLSADETRLAEQDDFLSLVKSYFEWLSGQLSLHGDVDIDKIYRMLDYLGFTEKPSF